MTSPTPSDDHLADFKAAATAIQGAERIALACHVNPDGDALGSMLGLAIALRSIGKHVDILSADGVPETMKFLPKSATVLRTSTDGIYDIGIGMDAGDAKRMGPNMDTILGCPIVIDIVSSSSSVSCRREETLEVHLYLAELLHDAPCDDLPLLDQNPNPSAEEVRQALAGNLCRCGAYPKIIESVLAASSKK